MRTSTRWMLGAAAAGALLVGCSKSNDTATTATTAAGSATSAKATDTTKAGATGTTQAAGTGTTKAGATGTTKLGAAVSVKLGTTSLGEVLVDGEGNTLYVFKKDTKDTSACVDACTKAWPPLAGSSVTPGSGLDAADFGTITRPDGTTQITFYGQPLYTFSGDAKPGDTTGQGTGSVWFVVGKDGTAIEKTG